jgi:hypothetical protein
MEAILLFLQTILSDLQLILFVMQGILLILQLSDQPAAYSVVLEAIYSSCSLSC